MRVLGIDPGLCATGYAIMEINDNECTLIAGGCVNTDNSEPRLRRIYENLVSMINDFQPVFAVVECTFVNINPRTSLALGQARGVCLLSLEMTNVEYMEITTSVIRKKLTNRGNSTKRDVQNLIESRFNRKMSHHISDAIASIVSVFENNISVTNLKCKL